MASVHDVASTTLAIGAAILLCGVLLCCRRGCGGGAYARGLSDMDGDDHVKVAFDGGGDARRVVDISLQFLETSDELLEMIRQAAAEVGGPAFELCHVQVRYRDAGGAMVD